MATSKDLSTLICLFHHRDHAHTALEEILQAGIPEANVTLIGDAGSTIAASTSALAELNVPKRDLDRLLEGIQDGGAVLSVSAISADADKVEAIFEKHNSAKIDEAVIADDMSAAALPLALDPIAIPGNDPIDSEDDLALITEEVFLVQSPTEGVTEVHVLQIETIEAAEPAPLNSFDETGKPDTDPRELGFDARMQPVVFSHQVD